MSEKKPFEDHPGYEKLDEREIEVLGYLADGKGSKEISFLIISTERTVDFHRMNIMDKLGIEKAEDLVVNNK